MFKFKQFLLLILVAATAAIVFSGFGDEARLGGPNTAPVKFGGVEVSDMGQLNKAISSAKPGDVIVMADGVWPDARIDFNASATEKAPVTIRARTPGKVVLTGESKLTFSKPYL